MYWRRRDRRVSVMDSEHSVKVSVVVPVYNGGRGISATIEHVIKQSLVPWEIIVVDDGSTDHTPEVLRGFGDKIIVLRKENGGPAAARNCGIRAASGDFVAFTDSDAFPDREWLANLLKGFDTPRVAGVGGVVNGINTGILPEYADIKRFYDPGRDGEGVSYLVTCNACFRRDVLVEAGLFDERFRKPGAEDAELCVRIKALGYEFRAVGDAVVLHHHKSIKNLLRAQSNYGEGGYILGSLWPEYRWKGSPRKGLIASLLAVPQVLKNYSTYRRDHGFLKALAFSFLDQSRDVACTWGYLRGERKSREHVI